MGARVFVRALLGQAWNFAPGATGMPKAKPTTQALNPKLGKFCSTHLCGAPRHREGNVEGAVEFLRAVDVGESDGVGDDGVGNCV